MNTNRFISIAALLLIGTVFFGFVLPKWSRDVNAGLTRVNAMEGCLETEKSKGHGQDHLDSTYRLCWMRAKTDASK